MFSDIIPRFKAAFEIESNEDLICRLTKELLSIFEYYGALEKYLLTNPNFNLIKVIFIILFYFCRFNLVIYGKKNQM